MPDIFDLLKNWWKQITFFIVLSLLIAGVLVWMKPLQYLSTATAIPASAFASDRSRLFNENIQTLYSDLGTPDDLDIILGTAQLDTVYLAVTDQFNLFDHYRSSEPDARIKAAKKLRCNSRVSKSDYGELKVRVWDTDKNLAPQLANAILGVLQTIHSRARNANNEATLISLKNALKTTKSDSLSTGSVKTTEDRRAQYEKLIQDYQLMVDSKNPTLIVVENARPSLKPDRPNRIEILVATGILAFLFAVLCAMVLERKKLSRIESLN